MANENPETFQVQCPCCDAELVIDPKTRSVLHHQARQAAAPITDLAAEVSRLKNAGAAREEVFQRSLAAEKTKEERLDRKFEELLRRAKQAPDPQRVKDVDL